MAENRDGIKFLRADRLIELLRCVPPDSGICANRVGNLSVMHPEGHPFAFIDFVADGDIECWEPDMLTGEPT